MRKRLIDSLRRFITGIPDAVLLPISVVVAVLIYALFGNLPHKAAEILSDPDFAIRLAILARTEKANSIPVTFIDIDESAHRAWGAPAYTPREKLVELIEVARKGGPLAVVVDIDTSLDDADPRRVFQDYLASFRVQTEGPPLLLVRGLQASAYWSRSSRLDALVAEAPLVRWIGSTVDLDDDHAVRFWKPVHTRCSIPLPTAYGSTGLIGLALAASGKLDLDRFDMLISETASAVCAGRDPGRTGQLHRVPYLFGFDFDGNTFIDPVTFRGRRTQIMQRIDAGTILRAGSLDAQDRIVVIGASYALAGDVSRTPLGRMPGFAILGNIASAGHLEVNKSEFRSLMPLFLSGFFFLTLHFLIGNFSSLVALMLGLMAVASSLWAGLHLGIPPTDLQAAFALYLGIELVLQSLLAVRSAIANIGADDSSLTDIVFSPSGRRRFVSMKSLIERMVKRGTP